METVLYLLSLLAGIQGMVSLKDGWRNFKYSLKYKGARLPGSPAAAVFCPVTGTSACLADTVASLLNQDYADYRVVFVVESEQDPAFHFLSKTIPVESAAEIVVVGRAVDCGQKVHGLAQAVQRYARGAEIFVFCDADARFPPGWLGDLIGPLDRHGVGAATGYRWYVPPPDSLASRMRSAWNASVAGFLGPHHQNFAWGGSTAIRREVFDRAHVLERWRGVISDDYVLTEAVRQCGLEVVYVPSCLVPSYESCSWKGLLDFTTRQIQITRVYAPRIWIMGIASYTLFNVTFFWLMVRMFERAFWLGIWCALYAMAAARADIRLRAAAGALPGEPSLHRHRWFYRLSPPWVAMLYQWNFLASLFVRRIVWKGVRYRMVSRRETVVER